VTPSGSARRPIRRLSNETVERIAAGEVVERPASVVKELVENSVDAGAAHVTVRIEGGGLKLLEVADDGAGIPAEELSLAVERHATSKLDPVGPLEEIESLGFRGEALAAIASVSRFRLLSRPPRAEVAEGISVVGGKVGRRFSEGRAPGTTVEVRDLFFNTPARRKFLKSPGAEQLELVRTVERLYLARPSVSVRVESEGEDITVLPAATKLPDAAARVLGAAFPNDSFPVRGFVPGGTVEGILGRPSSASASSSGLYLSVNGRSITSRPAAQAVRAAFGDYLPRTRFPIGVLHLEIDPARVDVNVHPTKREVRFANERELVEALRVRVREALLSVPQVAEVRGEPSPSPVLPPPPPPRHAEPRAAESAPVTLASAFVQARLDTLTAPVAPVEIPAASGHPALTLLGCVQAIYWVAQSGEDLVIVDQHAASERVLYEAMLRDGTLARQQLVEPVAVRLTGSQREALRAHSETVRASGFGIEQFGPEHFLVRSVPFYRGRRVRADAVTGLLDELARGGRPTVADGLRERRAATIACHAAIRAGDTIEPEEMRRVLSELYALPESSYSCPHGRPILLRFTRSRLDRWFLRTGA
jgi:DNA mismatch repair protein MutL